MTNFDNASVSDRCTAHRFGRNSGAARLISSRGRQRQDARARQVAGARRGVPTQGRLQGPKRRRRGTGAVQAWRACGLLHVKIFRRLCPQFEISSRPFSGPLSAVHILAPSAPAVITRKGHAEDMWLCKPLTLMSARVGGSNAGRGSWGGVKVTGALYSLIAKVWAAMFFRRTAVVSWRISRSGSSAGS